MFRPSELLSFEAAFLPFFFVAAYKGSPLFESLGERFELTVVSMVIGMGAMLVGCLVGSRRLPLSRNALRFLFAYAVFLTYAVVSYLVSGGDEVSVIKIQKLIVFNTWAMVAPLLLVDSQARANRLLRLVVAVSLVFCLEAASQVVLGNALRIGALGGESYHAVGRYGGVAFLIAIVFILSRRRSGWQSWHVPVAVLLLGVVLLSMTRHAVVGIVVAATSLAVLKSRGEGGIGSAAKYAAGFLAIAAVGLTLGFYVAGDFDLERFQRRMILLTGDQDSLAESARVTIYRESFLTWLENPLFGVGFGKFQEATGLPFRQSHNLFLELLCELGVVGCGLYLWVLWFPVSVAWRQSRGKMTRESLATAVGGVFFLACSMFSGDLTDNRHIFIFAGLIMAGEVSFQRRPSRTAVPLPGYAPAAVGPRLAHRPDAAGRATKA